MARGWRYTKPSLLSYLENATLRVVRVLKSMLKSMYHASVFILCFMYGHACSKSMDQLGKVASPARGQLNRNNEYFLVRVHA